MKIRIKWIARLMAFILIIQTLSVIDLKPLQMQKVYADTAPLSTQTNGPAAASPLDAINDANTTPAAIVDSQTDLSENNLETIDKTDSLGTFTLDVSTENVDGSENILEPANPLQIFTTTTLSALSIPTNVYVNTTDKTLTESWDSVVGAESYDISLDDNITNTTATNYTYSSLKPNTQHTIKVRAVNQGGNSEWGTEITKYTLLATPSNLVATPSGISVDLAWDASIGATGYEIFRDEIKIGTSITNSYTDTVLTVGQTYIYKIKAFNDSGNVSTFSNTLTVTTLDDQQAPTNINATQTDKSIKLTWGQQTTNETTEESNLALGKSYIKSEQPAANYSDNNEQESTDNIIANDYSDGNSYGYKIPVNTTKSVDVTVDLGDTSTINNVKVHKWEGTTNYGADIITIYTSQDGINYKLVGSTNKTDGIWLDLSFSTIDARFVKVNFNKYNNGEWGNDWLFIDEIQVYKNATTTEGAISCYEIEVDGTVIDNGTSTTYMHNDLEPNSQHTYRIRAKNASGFSEWSTEVSKYTLLSTPSNLVVTPAGISVDLAWDTTIGATGYEIYRDEIKIGTSITNSYTDTVLTVGQTYIYKIKAFNDYGNVSTFSNTLTVTTLEDQQAPTSPTNLTMTANTATTVAISWDASTDNVAVKGYEIYRDGINVAETTMTEYIDSGLVPQKSYTYTVKAYDSNGNKSEDSDLLNIITTADSEAPTAPANLRILSVSTTSASISWDASADNVAVTSYDIYNGNALIGSVSGDITTYTISGLNANTNYIISVKAKDLEENQSTQSNTLSVTTLLPAPTSINYTQTDKSITLTWGQQNQLISTGKSYTKSEQLEGQYSDNNEQESTDGIIANDYSDGNSYGYRIPVNTTKSIDVTVDLGEISPVNNVKVHKWEGTTNYGADIITIYTSQDGINYKLVGSPNKTDGIWLDLSFSNIDARFIKVNFNKYNNGEWGNDWLFIDEIQVYKNETTEEVNLALGKLYTKSEQLEGDYPDKNEQESTDGILAKDYSDGNSYGYYIPVNATKSVNVTVDLGNINTVNNVKVHKWEGSNNYEADTINIYASKDGINYELVGSPSKTDGIWLDLSFSNIDARFIKVNFNKYNNGAGENDWLFIDEIQVYKNKTTTQGAISCYDIEVDGTVIDNGISTTYVHNNLEPNSQHTYKIRAKNAGGFSEWSTEISMYTLLSTPTNLVTTPSSISVDLNWDAILGATCYEIYRDDIKIGTSSTNLYYDSGLAAGKTYVYNVKAYNDAGNVSDFSNPLTVSTTILVPSIPTNVKMDTTDKTITTSWDSVDIAESYDISLDDNITNITVPNYSFNSLEPNTQHVVKVRAVNLGGFSEWSTEISMYTLLSTPTNLVATPSSISVDLTWDAISGGTCYEIYRDDIKIGTSSTNSYADSALTAGETYVYKIKAYNDAGNVSDFSNPLKVSILATIHIGSNLTLSEDKVFGDVYLTGGTLDLAGFKMTVNGKLIQSGGKLKINGGQLNVTGDYRIQTENKQRNGNVIYTESDGELYMNNIADYLFVGGSFVTQAHRHRTSYLTAGIMEVKGDFTQKNNGNADNFNASGTHTVVLSGNKVQTISFDYRGSSYFNNLEIRHPEGVEIKFINQLNVKGKFITNGCLLPSITIEASKWVLTADEVVSGDLYLEGSTLDLSGHRLEIKGKLIQSDGALKVNGGQLIIAGDYRIQTENKHSNGSGIYTGSSGELYMNNIADYIYVGGSFVTQTHGHRSSYLTAGIMEVKGDFIQKNNGNSDNFQASGTHCVILSGNAAQTISLDSRGFSYFNTLEIKHPEGVEIKFLSQLNVKGTFITNGCILPTITVRASNWVLTADEVVNGDLYLEGSTLNLSGHKLEIKGKLIKSRGTLKINGGQLIIDGGNKVKTGNKH